MTLTIEERQIMLHELNPDIPISGNGKSNSDAQDAYNEIANKNKINTYDEDKLAKTDAALTHEFAMKYNATHPEYLDQNDPKALKSALDAVKKQDEHERGELAAANHYLSEKGYDDKSKQIADGSLSASDRRDTLADFKTEWNAAHPDKAITEDVVGSQTRERLQEVSAATRDTETVRAENHANERTDARDSNGNRVYVEQPDAAKLTVDERIEVRDAFRKENAESIALLGGEKNAAEAINNFANNHKGQEGSLTPEQYREGVAQEVAQEAKAKFGTEKQTTTVADNQPEPKPQLHKGGKHGGSHPVPHAQGSETVNAHNEAPHVSAKSESRVASLQDDLGMKADVKTQDGLMGKHTVDEATAKGMDTSMFTKLGEHQVASKEQVKQFFEKNGTKIAELEFNNPHNVVAKAGPISEIQPETIASKENPFPKSNEQPHFGDKSDVIAAALAEGNFKQLMSGVKADAEALNSGSFNAHDKQALAAKYDTEIKLVAEHNEGKPNADMDINAALKEFSKNLGGQQPTHTDSASVPAAVVGNGKSTDMQKGA